MQEAGHVDLHHLWFVSQHVERIKDVAAETVREIDDLVVGQYAAIYPDHPFLKPSDQVNWLRRMLERPGGPRGAAFELKSLEEELSQSVCRLVSYQKDTLPNG